MKQRITENNRKSLLFSKGMNIVFFYEILSQYYYITILLQCCTLSLSFNQ